MAGDELITSNSARCHPGRRRVHLPRDTWFWMEPGGAAATLAPPRAGFAAGADALGKAPRSSVLSFKVRSVPVTRARAACRSLEATPLTWPHCPGPCAKGDGREVLTTSPPR